jgi:hypothetical protein
MVGGGLALARSGLSPDAPRVRPEARFGLGAIQPTPRQRRLRPGQSVLGTVRDRVELIDLRENVPAFSSEATALLNEAGTMT